MSGAAQITIETRHDPLALAAGQAWARRSIFPLWMRVFGMVLGALFGVAAGAGVLIGTQIVMLEIDPQLYSRAWLVFPIFVLAGTLFLWVRYQRFHVARLNAPHGNGLERFHFDVGGFSQSTDGAERRYAWWLVDDMGTKGAALFMRIGTVLHTVPQAGDAAQFATIRALWQAGRKR